MDDGRRGEVGPEMLYGLPVRFSDPLARLEATRPPDGGAGDPAVFLMSERTARKMLGRKRRKRR